MSFCAARPQAELAEDEFPNSSVRSFAPAKIKRFGFARGLEAKLAFVQNVNRAMCLLPQQQKGIKTPQRFDDGASSLASRACPSRCLTPFVGGERSAKPKGANGSNNKHCASCRQRRESSASVDAREVNLKSEKRPAHEHFKEGLPYSKKRSFRIAT